MPFSAVIITKNEAHNIERTLIALQEVCTDIVIVDSGSTDATIAICERLGVRVISYDWKGYAANKNYGASCCENDWVLSIDADEVLSDELINSLSEIQLVENTVYSLDRFTNYCGQWIRHSGWYPEWKPRLYQRTQVHWQGDFVHETLAIPKNFNLIRLEGKLLHYSYTSSEDHLERIERYAQLSAQQLFAQHKKTGFLKLWLAPVFRFFKTYILKRGFLDGKNGWIISCRNASMVHRKYRLLNDLWKGKD